MGIEDELRQAFRGIDAIDPFAQLHVSDELVNKLSPDTALIAAKGIARAIALELHPDKLGRPATETERSDLEKTQKAIQAIEEDPETALRAARDFRRAQESRAKKRSPSKGTGTSTRKRTSGAKTSETTEDGEVQNWGASSLREFIVAEAHYSPEAVHNIASFSSLMSEPPLITSQFVRARRDHEEFFVTYDSTQNVINKVNCSYDHGNRIDKDDADFGLFKDFVELRGDSESFLWAHVQNGEMARVFIDGKSVDITLTPELRELLDPDCLIHIRGVGRGLSASIYKFDETTRQQIPVDKIYGSVDSYVLENVLSPLQNPSNNNAITAAAIEAGEATEQQQRQQEKLHRLAIRIGSAQLPGLFSGQKVGVRINPDRRPVFEENRPAFTPILRTDAHLVVEGKVGSEPSPIVYTFGRIKAITDLQLRSPAPNNSTLN